NTIKELHKLLNIQKEFREDQVVNSYDVAHHVGLSLEEEYELLNLMEEKQRQEYLRRHLQKVVPLIHEMESLKEKIKLNGHFKNLSGFNFELE
ncbi:MAG TPA: peptidase S16, partial [Chitinophagaceae bacterium]